MQQCNLKVVEELHKRSLTFGGLVERSNGVFQNLWAVSAADAETAMTAVPYLMTVRLFPFVHQISAQERWKFARIVVNVTRRLERSELNVVNCKRTNCYSLCAQYCASSVIIIYRAESRLSRRCDLCPIRIDRYALPETVCDSQNLRQPYVSLRRKTWT